MRVLRKCGLLLLFQKLPWISGDPWASPSFHGISKFQSTLVLPQQHISHHMTRHELCRFEVPGRLQCLENNSLPPVHSCILPHLSWLAPFLSRTPSGVFSLKVSFIYFLLSQAFESKETSYLSCPTPTASYFPGRSPSSPLSSAMQTSLRKPRFPVILQQTNMCIF